MLKGSSWSLVCDVRQRLVMNVWRPDCPASNVRRRRTYLATPLWPYSSCNDVSCSSPTDILASGMVNSEDTVPD